MLKILFNKKSNVTTPIYLDVRDMTVIAKIEPLDDFNTQFSGYDAIESLNSYNSYSLVFCENSKVKVYREIFRSNYKFIDLNRLGVATKLDFADIIQLYGERDIMQIDTGIISATEKDIVIRIFEGNEETTVINTDLEYEIGYFNSDDLVTGSHPRDTLWDSYSLSFNENEVKSNRYGNFFEDPSTVYITPNAEGYVDFTIKKYKGKFESELTRDIDDEDVLIDSSAGLVTNRRVTLENGVGTFRLYTFGYQGRIKIKLGRKWYEVWNEYNLIITGN